MFGLFKTKCPKCGGTDLTKVKPSLSAHLLQAAWLIVFWPVALFKGPKPPLMVCKTCGFSWEKR